MAIKFIRNPTSDILDTVDFMSQDQREMLMQEQFQNDHLKGILQMQELIKQIEAKLAKMKQKLTTDQAELEKLREQRAKVSLQKDQSKKLAELDKEILAVEQSLRFAPDTIKELERQLAEAKAKFAAEARDELLNKQKEGVVSVKELSKELVAELKSAVDTNQKLHTAYAQYKQIHDLTKVDLLGAKACEPSVEMLQYLYGFLRGELEEGNHCRVLLPGCPRI